MNLTEAVTRKEYKTSLSDEDYPVLFGSISLENDKIISVMSNRNNTHGNLGFRGGDRISWRYVPMTETLYWWFRPKPYQKQSVIDYIQQKYGFKVLRNAVMDTEGMITNHSREYSKSSVPKIPSFQEWYNAHQGD